ncbi:ATP-binding protein [Rhodopseudomonas sp. HC1]|uniref:AAA family ATPase n=1 Tax=Rhodopseudomonas infernalis TaxID=2897386 RepID=UPI001EE83249|nr:ATP-binding protein [Rhodopseudomonas infernalis]MCG6205397.1 ATP-binding protein [Rhodopseudomonas infernalis]
MLRAVSVSGFKSLDDFKLEFHKGLNVLIGPNGSGKTNIINFLEFLAHLARNSLLDAVSRSGGAGKIFRRDHVGALRRRISFKIIGDGEHQDYRSDQKVYVWYEYDAEISLSKSNSALSYTMQRLRMAFGEQRDPNGIWPIDVEVLREDEDDFKLNFVSANTDHFRDHFSRKKETFTELQASIEETIKEDAPTSCLYQILSRFLLGSSQISRDLVGAKSLNISPSAVRKPEDIASEPEISEDGSGLAAVLFALSARPRNFWAYGPYLIQTESSPETLAKLISYSRIVNESIEDITVEPDTIENQLRIFVKVSYEDGTLKLPFSLVSDGTAKWFTLVTAILTSHSIFAIEEPENFLHPLMQREIVKIVRETFNGDLDDRFAIMTTHSETILNNIDPDEMILVHMENGRTLAKRPTNADDIREEINETGFGAGFFYLSGALE